MSVYQEALLIGAVLVALISFRLDRAVLWILAGAASFAASTAYGRYGLPIPPLFTALCDAAVCLMIYGLARRRFELYLYRIFQSSVLVSIVFLMLHFWSPQAASRYVYVTILELLNWAALALILGTGIAQKVGGYDGALHRSIIGRGLRWAERTLLARKKTDHWWQR